MLHQTWDSEYTPCVDLGWRLQRESWGKGFATEAANACVEHAFKKLNIDELYAFATDNNKPSQHVMDKIGMSYQGNFQHPKIKGDTRFKHCVAYKITS